VIEGTALVWREGLGDVTLVVQGRRVKERFDPAARPVGFVRVVVGIALRVPNIGVYMLLVRP
jgi:hypothetical protein